MNLRICCLLLRLMSVWLCMSATAFPAAAEKAHAVVDAERPDEKSLTSLTEEIEDQRKIVEARRKQLNETKTPEERKAIYQDLTTEQAKLVGLEHDFVTISACVPYEEMFDTHTQEFSVNKELNDLLLPLLSGIKQATQQPRAIEMLKNTIQSYQDRLAVIETGIKNVETYLPSYDDPKNSIKPRLKTLLADLKKQRLEVVNKITILQHQQDDLEDRFSQRSIFASSTEVFRRYFRTRGWNLLCALVVFLVIFAGSRLMLDYLHRIGPLRMRGGRSFYQRLLQVLYYGFTFVGAVMGALLVLYVQGDWALLSLAILFLAGAVLVAKNSLPKFYDQTRLLLNLGEVREGERVVISGVPWRVDSIGLYAMLSNPWLTGGNMRLPLRQLSAHLSRQYEPDEIWFPCKQGDWVALDDGAWGKVVLQTPEMVQMVMLGGARKTYTVAAFMEQNPKNLSTGFRVTTTLGVDYGHQSLAISDIPPAMREHIFKGVSEEVGRGPLLDLAVEFAAAADSSLQIYVAADFDGALAPKRDHLQRLLQRLGVEACDLNGWKIPFPQMELHVPGPVSARGLA